MARDAPSIDAYGDGGFRLSGERREGSLLIVADAAQAWPVANLAELISLCSLLQGERKGGDGPLWAAHAALLAEGGLEEARAALRDLDDPAPLLALARDPLQLPALIRVGGEADVAFKALKTFRARSSDLTLNIFSSNR